MRTLPLLLLLLTTPALAERLVVVELFTSQGCSSCPPADAALAELAKDASILPLGLHVTYWDRLGWKDPYSLPAATERQRAASARLGLDTVYTPQMLIDGRFDAVGSDRRAVAAALAAARADRGTEVPLSIAPEGGGVRVRLGAGAGQGTVLLVGFDARHTTPVRAGENGGRTLTEVNVVRAIAPVATWAGQAAELSAARPAGERVAVLLQSKDGRMLATAVLP